MEDDFIPRGGKTKATTFLPLPTYRVANKPPSGDISNFAPGIRMRVPRGRGPDGKIINDITTVQKVRAVILYASPTRALKGRNGEVQCQSHDGHSPSARVASPGCHKLNADGVVQIISKWKGMDQARIDSTVLELTEGDSKLHFCALPTKSGDFIPICPMATRDPIRNQPGPCKPGVALYGFDLDNKREFRMDLGGREASTSPNYHGEYLDLLNHLRDKRIPCYAQQVELSHKLDGKFYALHIEILDVLSEQESEEMFALAKARREAHQHAQHWTPNKPRLDAKQPPQKNTEVVRAEDQVPFDDDIPF